MLDTIIRGGDVVTPQGVLQCDVAIVGETIAAMTATQPSSATTQLRMPTILTLLEQPRAEAVRRPYQAAA